MSTTTPVPTAHTTRRNLLIAAPAVAAIAALPTIALARTSSADRRAWNAAMANYERVKAEDTAFSKGYMALWERCKAACAHVPHVALRPDPYTPNAAPLTTADEWHVRMARYEVQQMDSGKMWLDPKIPEAQARFDLQRELAQAADERDAALKSIRDRFGMEEADEESGRLGDIMADADSALMNTPAPDLAALRWKLDFMLADDSTDSTPAWSMDFVAQALADIARLLPEAG